MSKAEERALEVFPSTEKEWKSEFGTFHFDDTNIEHREGFIIGYEQAEKDILALIESRLSEIIGDAQPKPILRMELEELINKIKI